MSRFNLFFSLFISSGVALSYGSDSLLDLERESELELPSPPVLRRLLPSDSGESAGEGASRLSGPSVALSTAKSVLEANEAELLEQLLLASARDGNWRVFDQAVLAGRPLDVQDAAGRTALMYLASSPDPVAADKLTKLLMLSRDRQFELANQRDQAGRNALAYALQSKNPRRERMITELVALGSAVPAGAEELIPVDLLAQNRYTRALKAALDAGFQQAILNGDVELVASLIAANAPEVIAAAWDMAQIMPGPDPVAQGRINALLATYKDDR